MPRLLILVLTLLISFTARPVHADDVFVADDVSEKCEDIQCGSHTYRISQQPPGDEEATTFNELTAAEQSKFYSNRRKLLSAVLKLAHSGRLVLGTGVVIKNWIVQKVRRTEANTITFSQLTEDTVNNLINTVDLELWRHSRAVAASKEFGVSAVINLNGGAHFVSRGFYKSYGLGLAFGFNSETEKCTFEIFQESYSVTRALPVVAQAAVTAQFMGYASVTDRNTYQRGRFLNPPGPLVSFDTPEMLAVGLSMGVGLPPFDSLFSYEAAQNRITLFRMSIPAWRNTWKKTPIPCRQIFAPDDIQ
jgi:hypothetical protein